MIVTIPKGSSSSKVGSILASDGVVSSGFFFEVRALLEGKRSSLHSGRFELKHDMSYSEAIDALSKPPPRAIAVKVASAFRFTDSGAYADSSRRSSRFVSSLVIAVRALGRTTEAA